MRPLVIDNFAGGGGASTGLARAIGREPDVASILASEGVIGWCLPEQWEVLRKRDKIESFMAISREQGVLK